MEIYKIEDYKKNRKLVYLKESTPAFCLYSREIKQFGLEEGGQIDQHTYEDIITLLSKRAKERCLYLLDDMARTEYQIRTKLKDAFYPDEAIDSALSDCIEKRYIDDRDYAERYAASKSKAYSRRMIEQKLYQKGISRDIIDDVMCQSDIDEAETVRELIQKKYGDVSGYSYEEKQKIIKKFLTKGFPYDSVKQAFTFSQ